MSSEMATSCTECPANSRCPNKDSEPIACEGGFVSNIVKVFFFKSKIKVLLFGLEIKIRK